MLYLQAIRKSLIIPGAVGYKVSTFTPKSLPVNGDQVLEGKRGRSDFQERRRQMYVVSADRHLGFASSVAFRDSSYGSRLLPGRLYATVKA
jgi:hypothetical protein